MAEQQPRGLKERLAQEMRAALKGRQTVRLGALRLLSAAVKNREVELRRPLAEEEFIEVAAREVKRRKEAVEAYLAAGREDRAAREREEQQILEAYLPAALAEDQVDSLIDQAIASTGASSSAEVGKVMGFVMARARGRIDGRAVQAKVRRRLGG